LICCCVCGAAAQNPATPSHKALPCFHAHMQALRRSAHAAASLAPVSSPFRLNRYLVLSDGTVFTGKPLGASGVTTGEVVFNTAMTGYQEILSDPSYAGQVVLLPGLRQAHRQHGQPVERPDAQVGAVDEAGLAAESIMDGGIDLFVFGFNGKEKTPIYAAKRAPVEDVCSDFYRIEMEIKDRLGLGLGVNASWNPMPRVPKRIKTPTAAYKTAITNLLRKEGVKRPVVKTTQIFLIDLDGDGTDEALITATNITSEFGVGWKAGEYSFVMLRKVTKDGVKDYLVDGNIFKIGQDNGGGPKR